ncbi:hypothetical protein D9M70_605720 [compost metagenome]
MIGIDGPEISASRIPTLAPAFLSAIARLAVTVDFPTPPFPEEMAIMFFTPGSIMLLLAFEVTLEVILIMISKPVPRSL